MITLFTFTETSPAAAGTAASVNPVPYSTAPNGIAAGQLDDYAALVFVAELQGATGGVLDVFIQNWFNDTWYDFAHYNQLAAGAAATILAFSVSSANQTNTHTVVGKNLVPLLAAGSVIAGAWGDRFRLVMKAGAGTTLGAPVTVKILGQRQGIWRSS